MKKTLLKTLALATLFFASAANAQVGVGVPAGDIHPSAELEVKSTEKGFLLPRMTKAQRIAIGSPATGLIVYQTDGDVPNPAGLYYFDGLIWKNGIGAQGVQGLTGPQGPIGPAGANGTNGSQGLPGAKGDTGDQGIQGIQGLTGPQGLVGPAGANGTNGAQGLPGAKGDTGDQGIQGIQGLTGPQGPIGPAGANGTNGAQGLPGAKGDTGDQGIQGETGAIGPQGTQGIQGIQGPKGEVGPAGANGATGDQGIQGPKGDKGDVGATGPQGEIGPAGEQGLPSFVYANAYPYPPSIKTGFLVAGSKTYCTTYSLPATITFSEASVVHNNHGSDQYSIAIYRGDLTNGVLVGQTNGNVSLSPYDTKSLTEAPGQNLTFTAGSQVSVCYCIRGSTSSPAFYNSGVNNRALGMISSSSFISGFPPSISSITGPASTATSTRICMDLK